jgi:hypothetical protein
LQEQRKERDEEDQEDGHNAPLDPIKYWDKIIATTLSGDNVAVWENIADTQFLVEGADEQH